jgi:hypothetical protein
MELAQVEPDSSKYVLSPDIQVYIHFFSCDLSYILAYKT